MGKAVSWRMEDGCLIAGDGDGRYWIPINRDLARTRRSVEGSTYEWPAHLTTKGWNDWQAFFLIWQKACATVPIALDVQILANTAAFCRRRKSECEAYDKAHRELYPPDGTGPLRLFSMSELDRISARAAEILKEQAANGAA